MHFDHAPQSLAELSSVLSRHGVSEALIKPLSKNHNDKNQIYSGSDFAPLYPTFDLEFSMRGASKSAKKAGKSAGKAIPEAVFRRFVWVDTDGGESTATGVRMIIYAQYPETRLSGFKTVDNMIPKTLSVEYTRANEHAVRFLVLGRRGSGEAVAVMVAGPSDQFVEELGRLPNAPGSRVWKHLRLQSTAPERLLGMLARTSGIRLPGRRLDPAGLTLPFNGTQVCGYTLEHALGIIPNSDKNGDFEGIELKTHTQSKVTLFTPEPDMGTYSTSFPDFMKTYGYLDGSGHYRLTGVHRVGVRNGKSGLVLKIMNHERGVSLASKADEDVHVGLFDDDGQLAAGWSLERILNCWNSKHNEAVYIPATKVACDDAGLKAGGHNFIVEFADQIMWCRQTSAEQLFEALYSGTLFLDPAPKYCPEDVKLNKRRSQWRVNDITQAARHLYSEVRRISLKDHLPAPLAA